MAPNTKNFLEELAADENYQRMLREKEKERAALRRILDEDQKDLVAECRAAGVPIRSVWDLVNTQASYAPAIPILVKHLEVEHHPRTTEGIVRALNTVEGRGIAFPALVALFRDIEDSGSQLKWLVGSSIAMTATEDDAATIQELIEDDRHGRGRAFLPMGLIHQPKESVLPLLERLKDHPDMGESATEAVKKLTRRSRKSG